MLLLVIFLKFIIILKFFITSNDVMDIMDIKLYDFESFLINGLRNVRILVFRYRFGSRRLILI